jgi:hypothetical protein
VDKAVRNAMEIAQCLGHTSGIFKTKVVDRQMSTTEGNL